ncbi:MAG: ribulose-phosphate 3-epimerase [Elusimicrobia bacterium]|jgi:ribulose-phosphate 3-epimerase|nr:ribulose-phosphate 3-epimerase [Elusimicrobiota bacterium]
MKLSVSVLDLDFGHLEDSIRLLESADIDSLHMDIMDGQFVDNISFGPAIVRTIADITVLPVYSHLMIKEPEKYVKEFFNAGSDSVTVHIETIVKENKHILDTDNIGLSLNPDIELSELDPYLNKVSEILVMSVYAGFGGQNFIESSLGRIEELRKKRDRLGAGYKISVDGGINPGVASRCVKAGADEVITGSYISASKDPVGAVKSIREAVRNLT